MAMLVVHHRLDLGMEKGVDLSEWSNTSNSPKGGGSHSLLALTR
jgi:hypothetical protein